MQEERGSRIIALFPAAMGTSGGGGGSTPRPVILPR
jgi:hypothetical protein